MWFEFEPSEALSKQFENSVAEKYRELYRTNLKEAEAKAKARC